MGKIPESSTLEAVVERIRSDQDLAKITALYRQNGSKQTKEQSPMFAVAATFEGGKAQRHITGLTGLSLVDLDHVAESRFQDIRNLVVADAHTLLCYTTISGMGLRIIYRYELDSGYDLRRQMLFYPKAFGTGNDYYERISHAEADRQCKNVNRLSALAHDPDVYFNPSATAFTMAEMAAGRKAATAEDSHSKMVRRIENYYNKVIVKRLPQGLEFAPGSHNAYVMRVGYMLAEKRYRLPEVLEWAQEKFADYADTRQVIESCFANVRDTSPYTPYSMLPYATVGDIEGFLGRHIRLRQNVVSGRLEYLDTAAGEWQPFVDRVLNTLWMTMARDFRVPKALINDVANSDFTPLFDPFRDYLDSLPEWHEGDHDYIADLAATVKVRDDADMSFYSVLKKWLVAMVASWTGRSTVNHVILVLIGEQGIYKTTWFNYLLPPELRNYFYTKVNISRMTRDEMVYLSRYGLMCYEELDSMSPADLNRLKGIVTMEYVDEREPYARYADHRPHIASFCGTGNNPQFLTDPTGNRRWMPFEVESITSPRDHPFDYQGIYSQVYALLRGGFRYYFSQQEVKNQNIHNRNFESPNMELELVSIYFRKPNEGELGIFVSATRAMQIIGSSIAQRLSPINIGRAFKELGFECTRFKGIKGYWVMERSAEEMRLYLKSIPMEE